MAKDKFHIKKHSTVRCPECSSQLTNVVDVRFSSKTFFDMEATRRRKVCLECAYTFSTYEITKADFKRLLRRKNIMTEKRLRDFTRDIKKLKNMGFRLEK